MPSRVHAQAVRRRAFVTGFARGRPSLAAVVVTAVLIGAQTPAPSDVSDAVLEKASEGRTVDIGLLSTGGGPSSPRSGGTSVVTIPLEVYVARVLAGEAEPGAPDRRSRRSPSPFAPTPSSTKAVIAVKGSTCATRRIVR